ncbi:UDP-N-acetylmuramoyl-L-alanine--D-glutamate ligase [Candidatus Saccharibacteria bacterium]|nr:UDP-N-acetylmuramoyl-L-alanine--D-glutamate ligase [Candidatus Saccharibacteria bacterium]
MFLALRVVIGFKCSITVFKYGSVRAAPMPSGALKRISGCYNDSMKLAILGYGSQGKSAYEYWKKLDYDITVCDNDESLDLPNDVGKKLGDNYLEDLNEFDLIVRSPSVHPNSIIKANGEGILNKVTSVTNEFFRICPSKNIVGVTGTKGKGTTSTLIAKMLEASGKKVHLGGNIGTPPLELIKGDIQPADWVVLELANFQLIDLRYSPKIAVCVMIAPEHLDWHTDVGEYFAAKKPLFKNQDPDNIAIYYAKNEFSRDIASASPGHKIPYYHPPGAIIENDDVVIDGQSICSVDEIKLLGKHNWQNVCAATTAFWQIDQDVKAIRSVLTTFSGMEHRLELVRELNGVKYYDDSFGTTPETAIVAMEAFARPKVVILGGSEKGASFKELALTVKKSNVRKAILIGVTAPKIQAELDAIGFSNYVLGDDNMPEIVDEANKNAKPGDIVLLSTGCASFGLFKNYKDRAEQFIKAVQALA